MEIKVQIFGNVYAVLIGRNTKWFQSIYFFQIIKEWHDTDRTVEYAELIFKF